MLFHTVSGSRPYHSLTSNEKAQRFRLQQFPGVAGYGERSRRRRATVSQNRYRTALPPCELSCEYAAFRLLLAGACWALLMPAVISVSIWLPASSVLSACSCLERYYVHESSATSRYNRPSNTASSWPPDSNRKLALRLAEHRKSLTEL